MTIMTIMTKMSSFKITGARGMSVTYLHFMGYRGHHKITTYIVERTVI